MKTNKKLLFMGIILLFLPLVLGYGKLIGPAGVSCSDCNDVFLNLSGTNANQDINISPYDFYASNILTTDGYYSGQPIDGSIGSGIINSSSNKIHCGCINVTDEGGLNAKYPDLKVRIWNLDGSTTYCDIAGDTIAVPDNAHTVYYVNSSCSIASDTWDNYFSFDLNPANYAKIFDVYARNGDIGVIKGSSIIGLINKRTKWVNVNCGQGGHLAVCDGIDLEEKTFPDISQTAGHYNYLHTVHTSAARQASIDGIHLVHHTAGAWTHTPDTKLNLTSCDDGTNLISCSDNKYRRYYVYTMGFGNIGTKMHQLAANDSETYNYLADCLNVEENPISYTLPAGEDSVAVVHHFYCGKRDDTAWRDGWVDIRADVKGFGALPDLSDFMIYTSWSKNANANNKNLTGLDWLEALNLNITKNGIFRGNISVFGNYICNSTDCFSLQDLNKTGGDGGAGTQTLNDTYQLGGEVTVDNGDVIWDLVSTNDFTIKISGNDVWKFRDDGRLYITTPAAATTTVGIYQSWSSTNPSSKYGHYINLNDNTPASSSSYSVYGHYVSIGQNHDINNRAGGNLWTTQGMNFFVAQRGEITGTTDGCTGGTYGFTGVIDDDSQMKAAGKTNTANIYGGNVFLDVDTICNAAGGTYNINPWALRGVTRLNTQEIAGDLNVKAKGVHAEVSDTGASSGNITTMAVYAKAVTAGTDWSIYSVSADNYLEGDTYIGATSGNTIDMAGGDLFVLDDVEVGDDLVVGGDTVNITNLPKLPATSTSMYVCWYPNGTLFLNETGCRI